MTERFTTAVPLNPRPDHYPSDSWPEAEVILPDEPDVAQAYDHIASGYDSFWNGALAFAENQAVFRRLLDGHHLRGRVLDLGCGTGLALDWCAEWLTKSCYTGVDISQGMLEQAQRKHPGYLFCNLDLNGADDEWEDALGSLQYDSMISLFAVPSYLRDLDLFAQRCSERLVSGGKFAIMPFGWGEHQQREYRLKDASGSELKHTIWGVPVLQQVLENAGFGNVRVERFTSVDFHEQYRQVNSRLRFDTVAMRYKLDLRRLAVTQGDPMFLLATGTKA